MTDKISWPRITIFTKFQSEKPRVRATKDYLTEPSIFKRYDETLKILRRKVQQTFECRAATGSLMSILDSPEIPRMPSFLHIYCVLEDIPLSKYPNAACHCGYPPSQIYYRVQTGYDCSEVGVQGCTCRSHLAAAELLRVGTTARNG